MEQKLTRWDKFARGAGRAATWMGSQFASFFATFWLYIILWGVVAMAFTVLLYIDGIFSRSLAPDSINPLSFQAMGWAYRFFSATFLMAATRCALKGVPGKWTFRALGAFASVIVCLHAFGFGFEALSDRRDDAMAVREIVEIAETNNTALIATLNARKAQIDTDTDKAVEALNAEITQYITDGLNNDDLADDSRARRNALQDQAMADKRAIDDQVMQLVTSGAQDRTAAVEIKTESTAWHPLFVGLAQLSTWNKVPSDWAIYICAIVFIVFWVLLAESLVIFLPERIYLMHMHDAERARRSEASKKGHETRKEKEAVNQDDLQIEDEGYWTSRIVKALNTGYKTRKIKGMCDTYFGGIEPVELREHMHRQIDKRLELPTADAKKHTRAIERGLLSDERKTYLMQDHVDFIFAEGDFAPQQTNGKDRTPQNIGDANVDDSESNNVFTTA